MPYKIVTKSELDNINIAVNAIFGYNYDLGLKHPLQNSYIISVHRFDILEHSEIQSRCSFITPDWISSAIDFPDEFLWPYLTRTYRVKIPYQLQAKAIRTKNTKKDEYKLKLLIEVLNDNLQEEYSFYDSDYIITYLEEIYSTVSSCGNKESDLEVLQMFDDIIIEHYVVANKTITRV